MARRIAPNLRNTLADPAEYEVRLFYRGHESRFATDPAPAEDPNDPRPKLVSDDSRHGPPLYDDNYRCLWWLDEHDHQAHAASHAAEHQAAQVQAVQAKAAQVQAASRVPPAKLAWENAKAATAQSKVKETQAKNAMFTAGEDQVKASSEVYKAGKEVQAATAQLRQAGTDPAKVQAAQRRLDAATKALQEREDALRRANENLETKKREHEAAARDLAEKEEAERLRKEEYDKAVKDEQDAKTNSENADKHAQATSPGGRKKAEEERINRDAAATYDAQRQAAEDGSNAKELREKADEDEKAAKDAERDADEAEQNEREAKTKYDQCSSVNFIRKSQLKSKHKEAEAEAKRLRKAAEDARTKAEQTKAQAELAEERAKNSKAAAFAMAKRSANEPEPLAPNTEILKASTEKKYRIVVTDNHAAHDFVNSGGKSKPQHYRDANWMRDVTPAIPLEAVVRKVSDGKAQAVGANDVRVVWRVIDPPEELDKIDLFRGGARPKDFMTKFFNIFNQKSTSPESRNDNCSTQFGGLRIKDDFIHAPGLLFKAPLVSGAPESIEAMNPAFWGKSAVAPGTTKEGDPVGLSRVFMRPPPIGGDNYRLRMYLTDADGKFIKFRDHEGNLVEFIETGVFTVWRRLVIDLMVTFTSVDQTTIDWDQMRAAYRPAFTDVIGPVTTKKVDKANWTRICKSYFRSVGIPNSEINTNAAYDAFDTYLIPLYRSVLPIVHPSAAGTYTHESTFTHYTGPGGVAEYDVDAAGNLTNHGRAKRNTRWTYTEGLAKRFLDEAYKEVGRVNPRVGAESIAQNNGLPGLSVFFAKRPAELSTVLGQYMDEREFQFVQVGDVTCTFAHELGHAVYLYHAWTVFDVANGVHFTYMSEGQSMVMEHEQSDAMPCTMSYDNDYFGRDGKTVRGSNPVAWHFCAVCLLKLRFWDVEMLKTNVHFTKWILEGLGPTNANAITMRQGDMSALPSSPRATVANNGTMHVAVISAPEATVMNSGAAYHKVITNLNIANIAITNQHLAAGAHASVNDTPVVTFTGTGPKGGGVVTMNFTCPGTKSKPGSFRVLA
ncbi:MAG: hypothetical protein KF859_09530 [Phycisphaeraceae bacterium]|nr:hypothetical protein [Phycisphaeraceae bacterium]